MSWRKCLKQDLVICSRLNDLRQPDLWESTEQGQSLPISKVLDHTFLEYCQRHHSLSLDDLKEGIEHVANKLAIIILDKNHDQILLPGHRKSLPDRRSLPDRFNLLRSAVRLFSSEYSRSQLEAEVCRFIRGSLLFNSKTIDYFRRYAALGTRMFQQQERLNEKEIMSKLELFSPIDHKAIFAFTEMCISKGILRPYKEDPRLMEFCGIVDFWFLLAALFGLPVEISGLRFLFYGAIPICNPPGNNFLIRGDLGCGKTTLASNLAFEVADKGGLAIYFVFEQDVELLKNIYASFGWAHNDSVDLISIIPGANGSEIDDFNYIKTVCNQAIEDGRGAFILVDTVPGDFTNTYDWIDRFLTAFLIDIQLNPKLIILDPINAISNINSEKEPHLRQPMVRLLDQVRSAGACSLCIGEELPEGKYPLFFEESICDTVIHLTYGLEAYRMRLLEVKKSRVFPCVRGTNRFILRGGLGIDVYPSAASIAATKRGRHHYPAGDRMSSRIDGFDEILDKEGIRVGTITGFVGEPECGQTALALSWLAHGAIEDGQAGLYLTFQREAQDFEGLLAERAHFVLKSLPPNSMKELSRINVMLLETEGLTAGQIMYSIDAWLVKVKSESRGEPFRIVIDKLSYLDAASESVRKDRSFAPALLETVRTERVGVVLCFHSPREDEIKTPLQQQLSSVCDNLIEFRHVEIEETERIAVLTVKSRGMDHPRDARELVVQPNALRIEPNFSLFANVRSGKPRRIRVQVYLHYETEMQRSYNDRLKNNLENVIATEVQLNNEQFPVSGAVHIIRGSVVERNIRLLQIDDPHLDTFAEEDILLIPKNLVDSSDDLLTCCVKRMESRQPDYFRALAYFINVPLLLCDDNEANEKFEGSWSALADWVTDFDNQHKRDPQKLGFDFPKQTSGNYNSLFLEILLAHSGLKIQDATTTPQAIRDTFISYGAEAAVLYWRLAHRAHVQAKLDYTSTEDNDVHKILGYCQGAVYHRAWFSSVTEILSRKGDTNIRLARLPGKVETLGTWYIVAPKNCASPELAVRLCTEICNRNNSIERFERGIGMPPYSVLYGKTGAAHCSTLNFARHHLLEAANTAFIRSSIPKYGQFSNTLSFYLKRILEIGGDPSSPPKEDIGSMFADGMKIIEKILLESA